MSRESRAMTMDAAGSGKPRGVTIAGPRAQNSEPEVKAPKLASVMDGVNEHLQRKGEQFIPSDRPDRNLETWRARSSMFSNVERAHHVKQVCIRFEGKTRLVDVRKGETDELERETGEKMGLEEDTEVYMTHEGRKIGWRQLEEIQADGLVEMSVVMRDGGKKKEKEEEGEGRKSGE